METYEEFMQTKQIPSLQWIWNSQRGTKGGEKKVWLLCVTMVCKHWRDDKNVPIQANMAECLLIIYVRSQATWEDRYWVKSFLNEAFRMCHKDAINWFVLHNTVLHSLQENLQTDNLEGRAE